MKLPMKSDSKGKRRGLRGLLSRLRLPAREGGRRAIRTVREMCGAFCEAVGVQKRPLGLVLFWSAALGVILFSATVSLASFPWSAYPAGFALLAAVGGGRLRVGALSEKKLVLLEKGLLLTVLLGVLLSAALIPKYRLFYLLAYLVLVSLRGIFTGGDFRDSLLSRVTLSSAVSTGLGMLLAFFEGFPLSALFRAVSAGLLTPVFTYLISGFYVYTAVGERGGVRGRGRVYLASSVFALFYLFLYAVREAEWFGVSLSFVLAACAMLLCAKARGALFGAGVGIIGGMACAGSAAAPALGVGGFFAGLFFEYSTPVALMMSFVASCGYSLYAEGFEAFRLYTGDLLISLIAVVPLLRALPKESPVAVKSAPREAVHRETVRRTGKRLKTLSDAFSSLSEVFYTVSDTIKKPNLTEASRLISDVCSEVCSGCALSEICWGKDPALSAEATTTLSARLLAGGKVSEEDFSAPFGTVCTKREELAGRINRRYGEMAGIGAGNRKTSMLAGEYSAVSRLLKSTARDLDRELEYNPALEKRARGVLDELRIPYRRVAVFGNRELKIDVYGVALERVTTSSLRLVEAFEKAFSCRFEAPDFRMFEESVLMRLRRRRVLALECAKSGCTKKGESVSGDSCLFFETDRDLFYTLICDGMGSGRDAAFTSRLSSLFIEKLMHCATPKSVTLEMLNTFLMAKTDETFTTVDLLEVDLLSGEANFIKAGAAPSFVLRGDRLHRIESRTPPAGALRRMCAEQTSFGVREGDFVILMSDGAGTDDDAGWLIRLLSGSTFDHAAALCDTVFSAAKARGEFRDDLSVSVIRIMNAE